MKNLTYIALFVPFLALAAGCEGTSADSNPDGSGGTGTGGAAHSGGASPTGGTGGKATGGSATGGSATGGSATGGAATGGAAMGGAGMGGDGGDSLGHQEMAQESVPLGRSATFAILASAGITNIPTSKIKGDIGLTPDAGANVSGFSSPATCPEVKGNVYVVDATGPECATVEPTVLAEAKADAQVAFLDARAATRGTPQAISGDLAGLTLYPGLYESGSSIEISPGGALYLDAEGNGDAVFLLRSETSITTESTSEVVLSGGAKAANVYWIAGSAVTLGTNSIMKGTVIAGTSISLLTGVNLEGRAINQGTSAEAITLDACTVVVPTP